MTSIIECIRFLTDVRIKSGIALETVSLETRITMGVLKRIEEGDIEDFPVVYLRSYLTQYAKAVGARDRLDEILALFSQPRTTEKKAPAPVATVLKAPAPKAAPKPETGIKSNEKQAAHITPSPSRKTEGQGKPLIGIVIVTAILLGTVVWGINTMSATLFVRKKSDNAADITPAISIPTPVKRTAEPKREPQLSKRDEIIKRIENKFPKIAATSKKNAATNQSLPPPTHAAEGPAVDPTAMVIAKNNVFVTVKKDGQVIFRSMLLKGARETWTGNDKLELKISNPSDVILEITGSEVPTKNRQKPTNYIVTDNGFYTA